MHAAAKLVFHAGLVLLIAAFGTIAFLFGQRYLDQQPQLRVPIETDSVFDIGPLELDPDGARLAVELTISTSSVGEEFSRQGVVGELDLFRLPVHFLVRDPDGKVLFEQAVMADSVGERIVRTTVRERNPPTTHARRVMTDAFVPGDRPVHVEVTLIADETFGAQIKQSKLVVFNEPAPMVATLTLSFSLALAGLAVLLLGLSLELLPALLAGYLGGRRQVAAPTVITPVVAHGDKVIGRIQAARPRPLSEWPALAAERRAL